MIYLFIFIFAACFASFFTSLADRISYKRPIFASRSCCDNCFKTLKFWHLIPIFSYIFLKARCSFCKKKLSFHLILGELLCVALAFVALFYTESFVDFLLLSLYFFILYTLSLIDIRLRAVPEFLLFILFVISFFYMFDKLAFFDFYSDSFLLRICLFAGFIFLLKSLVSFFLNFKKYNKNLESMGEADILLISSMSSILGFYHSFCMLFLASLLAIIPCIRARLNGDLRYELPMFPFLSISFVIVFVGRNYEINL